MSQPVQLDAAEPHRLLASASVVYRETPALGVSSPPAVIVSVSSTLHERLTREGASGPQARELDAVQERVHRGTTALDPAREAVATGARVLGWSIDCLWRATFDHLYLDATAFQRAVLERRGDRVPRSLRPASLRRESRIRARRTLLHVDGREDASG